MKGVERRLGLFASLLLLPVSWPANGSPLEVTIRLKGTPRIAETPVSLIATASDGHHPAVQKEVAVSSAGPVTVTLDLPDEATWNVAARAAGYWSAPDVGTTGVGLDLWPTGIIRGEVAAREKGTPADGAVLLRFRTAPGNATDNAPPEGSVTCPVVDGKWSCEVPAAHLDLSLRIRGHASRFFWDREIPTGGDLALGRTEFVPGASLTGWVKATDRSVTPGMCRLSLQALPAAPPVKKDGVAPRWVGPPIAANSRGFFQFEAVPPGKYIVTASAKDLLPAMETVLIVEGAEASLREPLLLSRPQTLEVRVDPPQDPSGKAWRVSLVGGCRVPRDLVTVG